MNRAFEQWTIASVLEPDSFGRQGCYYFSYALYWIGFIYGPLWAVIDDRTNDNPRLALLKGIGLSMVASNISSFLSFISTWKTSLPLEVKFQMLAVFAFLGVGVLLFLGLPDNKKETRPVSGLPSWLAGAGGRFALLMLAACLSMLHFQIGTNFYSDNYSKGTEALWIIYVFSFPVVFSKLAAGPFWAIADDRKTEQPWFAVARAVCLSIFLAHIGGMVFGLQSLLQFPGYFGSYAANVSGFSIVEIAFTLLSAILFVCLPSPRAQGVTG
ncbi:hypothetical protein EON81_04165 [bacterium]|nr:MAG: hypothetical protein EON81_04165 [bacterium]